MQLTRLEINGFRGLYRTFDLSGDTIVTAGNGRGKTTILCALLWLLCGVDDEDKSNYNLFDNKLPQNDPTQPLRASVTGYFDTITITRSARQKWGKEGQRKGDEYTYTVNDMDVSASRFTEIIEQNFMPIPLLKFAMNIRRWEILDERMLREQICKLANTDCKPDNSKYAAIQWAISESGLDGAKKHFSKRRKEYSDAVQKLAIEITAIKARRPEVKDTAETEQLLAQAEEELAVVESRIHAAIPTDILVKRQEEERIIYEKKAEYEKAGITYVADANVQIAAAKAAWDDAKLYFERNLERRRKIRDAIEKREFAELDRKQLLDELAECKSRCFTGLCPTCGQELQGKTRDEKMEAFKQQKALDETRIINAGRKKKEEIESLNATIDNLQKEIIEERQTEPRPMERKYRELIAHYENTPFVKTEESERMLAEIAELEANRTPLPDMTASEADKVRKGELTTTIERLRSEIAVAKNNAEVAVKIQADIERLEAQRQTALRKLGESETNLKLTKEYEIELAQILQKQVNGQFNKIQIRMSDVSKLGEVVDCCKVEMASVADTLNTASRVVAGIEISLAFQRKYGVSLPMIIDNSESVERERIDADGRQLILLHMSEGQELNIAKYNNQ